MPKFSIASTLLIIGYFAVCSLSYVSENVAIGWLIVIATATVIAVAMIRSFQTRDVFGLGFAVFGCVWLSSSLGFAIETSTSWKNYNPRPTVWAIMNFGCTRSKIEDYNNLRESTFHDLYSSQTMIRRPDYRDIPNHSNAFRLMACWSALVAGAIGGMLFFVVMRPRQQITMQYTAARDGD